MSGDISAVPAFPVLPLEGEKKRTAPAAGEDRKISRGRIAADPAAAGYESGRLTITEDKATGDFVYRIVDPQTGEVLRQWPREEMLRMQQAINAMRGAIFDRRV
jgi:hypothetical protein